MIRAFALLGFLIGALALLPLRLVMPAGLSASSAEGSIWKGRLTDASWRGIRLGTLDVRLQPLPLLLASARLRIDGPDLSGTLILGQGVEALTGRRPLTGLPITSLEARDLNLRFGNGQCQSASGTVIATLPGSPAPVSATPRCTGATASLTLASPDGLASLTLALGADGQLRILT